MSNQYSHPWTKEEISWLKNEYPSHKLGLSYKTYLKETKVGAEVGCLCSLEPAYLSN
jgi:hypothetical protein